MPSIKELPLLLQRAVAELYPAYVTVRDVVVSPCQKREALLLRRDPVVLSGREAMRHACDTEVAALFSRYLQELTKLRNDATARSAVPYTPYGTVLLYGVQAPIVGVLGDSVVYVEVGADEDVCPDRIGSSVSPLTVVAAVVAAQVLGLPKVLLLHVGREKGTFTASRIDAEKAVAESDAVREVMADFQLLRTWADMDESLILGTGDAAACRSCPVANLCTARQHIPTARMDRLRVERDIAFEENLTQLLYGKNNEPNKRPQGVIHPSEMSTTSCDRRLYYELIHVPREEYFSAETRRVFDIGHGHHAVLQRAMRRLFPDFKEEVPVYDDRTKISGSCDGVFADTSLEIKSIGESGFRSLSSPKKQHEEQANTYTSILGIPNILYIYSNKASGELACMQREQDPNRWNATAARCERVVQNALTRTPPPKDTAVCFNCPFQRHCERS